MNETHHEREENVIEHAWKQGRALIEKITEAGGMEPYVRKHHHEAKKAFTEKQTIICCMDERLHEGVRIPASGLLIKDNPEKRREFIESCKARGIKDVTLHEGCGAVALYAQMRGIALSEAEQEARTWATELATTLGGSFTETLSVYPQHNHVAHAAYYDLSGTFKPSAAPEVFPAGFVISRILITREDALQALDVGFGIANGSHGFEKRFTKENPFWVVIVARSEDERIKLVEKVRRHLEPLGDKVRVDSFIAPQKN